MKNAQKRVLSAKHFDIGREILKWIAIIAMTIDHLGAILYPELIVLRIIGRLSFPVFCYLLVLGVESTRNVRNYFARLFLFAIVSQVPFYLALGYEPFEMLNVFFTLSFGVMFLVHPLLVLLPVLVSVFLNFDYGLYGIVWIACMRLLKANTKYGVVSLVLLGVSSLLIREIQISSLFALPIILLHERGYLKMEREVDGNAFYPTWTKYFYYVYYPLHLTALYLIKLSSS